MQSQITFELPPRMRAVLMRADGRFVTQAGSVPPMLMLEDGDYRIQYFISGRASVPFKTEGFTVNGAALHVALRRSPTMKPQFAVTSIEENHEHDRLIAIETAAKRVVELADIGLLRSIEKCLEDADMFTKAVRNLAKAIDL